MTARTDDRAQGTCGTCAWSVDADGVLTIAPGDGRHGTLGSYASPGSVPWHGCRDLVTAVAVEPGVSTGRSAAYLFYGLGRLTRVEGLGTLDATGLEDLFEAFAYCPSLRSLDLSGLDTSQVRSMGSLFFGCSSLAELDLTGWDTSQVRVMTYLLRGCQGLRTLKLGKAFSFTGDGTSRCELPVPISGTYGVGWWEDDEGNAYRDPADVPDAVAAAYTAVFDTADGYFADVANPSAWYYDAVYRMVERGYLSGRTSGAKAGSFGVGDAVTREELVVALWRIACPDQARDGAFAENRTGLPDVAHDAPYTAAVNWALERGVASGYTSGKKAGKFGVGDRISFQGMCLMIARCAAGAADVPTRGDVDQVLAPFTDEPEVSGWARAGMAWCVENDLVSGNAKADGTLTLAPNAKVSRARMAVVLHRAVEGGLLKARGSGRPNGA